MRKEKPKLPGFVTDMSAQITPAVLRPGQQAMLTLTLAIKPTYHIYANEPGDKFLTATVLTPKKLVGVRFGKILWPRPQRIDKALVYEKSVTVKIPLLVEPGMRPGQVDVVVDIQAQGCNEEDCFPPARFAASAPLRVERK